MGLRVETVISPRGALGRSFRVFFLLLLTGCGATQFNSGIPADLKFGAGGKIELPPIQNATGGRLTYPADQAFDEYMTKLLQERHLLSAPPHESAVFVLRTKLIEYDEGNAFTRWYSSFTSHGASTCTVHAELVDRKTGGVIGELRSRQTVSFGGAYSIGAYAYICKRVADDLIGEIDKTIIKSSQTKH